MNEHVEGQENTEVTPPDVDPEIEAEAVSNGWVPEDQYRGDKADWVDAKAFVKRGREINPILRKTNERLRAELKSVRDEFDAVKGTTKHLVDKFDKMETNAYARATADLKAQRRQALKDEDFETVDLIEEQIDALKEQSVKKDFIPVPAKAPETPSFFKDWQADNSWYDAKKNPDLSDMADVISLRLSKNEPDLKGRDFLDEVTRQVKKKFPEKFSNPNRSAAPMVESSSTRGASSGKRSYAALPSEAKRACDSFVKDGIMTQDKYLEIFYAGEE